MMTKLLLIRHGQSEANKLDIFTGQSDFALTGLGVRQAELTADYIERHYALDAVYASDLVRAYQTGAATARRFGLQPIAEPRLRELYLGAWEGLPYEQVWEKHPALRTLWEQDIGKIICPDGESVVDLQKRAVQALRDIAARHPGQTVAIASHACCIRSIVAYCVGGSTDCMKDIPWYSNASVTEIETEGNDLRLIRGDLHEHLRGLATTFTTV